MVRYRLFDLILANGLKKLLECIHKMSNQNLSDPHEQGELHRSLSNRHLQLIAIGGAMVPDYLWVQVKQLVLPDLLSYLFI